MKTRNLIFYLVLGAALGAVAGTGAAKALALQAVSRWWPIAVFSLSGAVVSAAGAASSGSRRAVWRDTLLGFALSGVGFLSLMAARGSFAFQVALVSFTLVFSAAVAVSHVWSLRERNAALAAGLFGGIGGLLALAAGVKLLSLESFPGAHVAAGAIYGGLVWLGVAAARRLFSVDVGQFRV